MKPQYHDGDIVVRCEEGSLKSEHRRPGMIGLLLDRYTIGPSVYLWKVLVQDGTLDTWHHTNFTKVGQDE
jgi:hypothetical protein